ncbi:MAG TPA: MFS transporter, partial [Nannocystaceae bacterium]|nr:MFS transporter [Nannocystaceae bacterium]
DQGMDADRVGILLGAGMWARLFTPFVGAWADRHGHGPQLALGLAVGVLASLGAFSWAEGFAALFVWSLVLGLAFAPIMPLVDGLALTAAAKHELDYGRVRLWGSAAFIVATIAGGAALEGRSSALVLLTLQLAALALVAATGGLLRARAPRPTTEAVAIRDVVRRPGMRTLLGAVACLQGGHAVLYGFGSEDWLAAGIDASTIGWLWAIGVIAEVVLFAFGERVVARIGAPGLLVIAGLGGMIRWTTLAEVHAIIPLFALQILHAASFAAMHLGAMSWIRRSLAGAELHRATGLYVAVAGGLALGLGMPLAGVLYERWHGAAYHAMTFFAAMGTWLALRLRARERGCAW